MGIAASWSVAWGTTVGRCRRVEPGLQELLNLGSGTLTLADGMEAARLHHAGIHRGCIATENWRADFYIWKPFHFELTHSARDDWKRYPDCRECFAGLSYAYFKTLQTLFGTWADAFGRSAGNTRDRRL